MGSRFQSRRHLDFEHLLHHNLISSIYQLTAVPRSEGEASGTNIVMSLGIRVMNDDRHPVTHLSKSKLLGLCFCLQSSTWSLFSKSSESTLKGRSESTLSSASPLMYTVTTTSASLNQAHRTSIFSVAVKRVLG